MRRAATDLQAKAAAARRKWLPLDLPEPRGGVRLVHSEIVCLITALRIKQPVQIRWSTDLRSQTTMASCRWMRGGRHLIKLRPNRSADEVSRSILHELVHAEQAEAHGSVAAWSDAYGKAGAAVSDDREVAYRLNAFEREARMIEDEFAGDFRLAASHT